MTDAAKAPEGNQPVIEQQKLSHRKHGQYITEHADRVTLLANVSPLGIALHMVFGRDCVDINEETLVTTTGGSVMQPTSVDIFRLDLANISMPAPAAKSLAEAILKTISDIESESPLNNGQPNTEA